MGLFWPLDTLTLWITHRIFLVDGPITGLRRARSQVTGLDSMDAAACAWLEHLYHDGEYKSFASDGLAAIQYFLPPCVGKLKHAWKLAKVWQRLEPPRRVLPISPLLTLGFAGVCYHLGCVAECAGLLVCFDAMLRSGELYQLRIRDITFYESKAVLSLGFTKTGKRNNSSEMVVVESPIALKFLRRACAQGEPHSFLLPKGPRFFRKLFQICKDFFGVAGLLTVYSLRRGGATWNFLQHQSMEKTLLRGRWASTASARLYLQDAAAMVAHLDLSANQRNLASFCASLLKAWRPEAR